MNKHGSIHTFKRSIEQISKVSHSHFFVYGNCDLLIKQALEAISKKCKKAAVETIYSLEAAEITEDYWNYTLLQKSFFEPAILYYIRRSEQSKILPKFLEKLNECKDLNNVFAFISSKEEPSKNILDQIHKDRFLVIPCLIPWPNELPIVASDIARELKLDFTRDAMQLILQKTGTNLTLLFNELEKLSLIFASDSQSLDKHAIEPFLETLREDDVFSLINYLLKGDKPRAHTLVTSLLNRGEGATNILGIIARHFRNYIQIKASGFSKNLKLPQSVYQNYIQSKALTDLQAARGLQICSQLEQLLKSTGISDSLLLSYLLEAFEN